MGHLLEDILTAVTWIRRYTKGMTFEDFAADRKTGDAVIRNLEIIGEAAGQLSESVRASAPDIEWRKIVGMRNMLAMLMLG